MARGRAKVPADAVEVATDVGPLLLPAGDNEIRTFLERVGDWELDETMLFRAHLRSGMTVVDVGAHVGYWTVLCARSVGPRGRVIAVEPHPGNAALLRSNVARNKLRNVAVIEAAAATEPGRIMLKPSREGNSGDNRLSRQRDVGDALEVDAVRLDDLLSDTEVGAVKVDAQGSDHLAIAGMEQTLTRCRPVVFVEFWPDGIRELGDDPAEVLSYYRSLPFRLTIPGIPGGFNFEDTPAETILEVAEPFPSHFVTLVLRPRDDGADPRSRSFSTGSARAAPDEPVDADELVAKLRSRVEKDGADADELAALGLEVPPPESSMLAQGFDLAGTTGRIRFRPELGFSSKRVVGPVITGVKRLNLRLLFYVLDDLARQVDAAVARLEAALAAEIAARESDGERAADALHEETQRREELELQVRALSARVAALEERAERIS